MAAAVTEMLERLRRDPYPLRAAARAEAARLFAPEVVCAAVSAALARLADGELAGRGGGAERGPEIHELTGSAS
jgi:hypothetical protein